MTGSATAERVIGHISFETDSELYSSVHPPEQEIYGRSLGTIRRLGTLMINSSLFEAVNAPEADQARVEFYTSVEEGFGTDMELGAGLEVRDYDSRPITDGKVMSKDLKTAVSAMTENGLICAEKTAKNDKKFAPQLTRTKWDHQNALIVDEMAQGKTDYNTRIVVSPFPEEAATESGDEYWRDVGYVPHLRRGFVQLYHKGKTELISGSLSFDGSNKERLRSVFAARGIKIPEGEITDNWLQHAFTGTMSEEEAKAFATEIADSAADPKYKKTTNTVDTTKQYRKVMDKVFDESYVHGCESLALGRQTEGAQKLIMELANKAQHFNERYREALYRMRADSNRFTDDDSAVLHELLVYSTIEMMRALHLNGPVLDYKETGGVSYDAPLLNPAFINGINGESFQSVLSGFGAEGAKNRRTYSACGLKISAGENERDNPQDAFGGKADGNSINDHESNEDKYGSLTFKCPKGHTNTRPRNKLIEKCKKCGTSVRC